MAEFHKYARCPKCGSTMLTDAVRLWCSFVGGDGVPGCSYGIDEKVTECPICFGLRFVNVVSRDGDGVKHNEISCFRCNGKGVIESRKNQ